MKFSNTNRMKKSNLIVSIAILLIAGFAYADTPTTQTQPAETNEEKQAQTYQSLLKAARESMVIVRTYYKKDLTDPTVRDEASELYRNFVDKKIPAETTGVVIADGLVLIAEDGVEDRFIDRIEVQNTGGDKTPARRMKLLYRAPNILLKLTGPGAKLFQPISFVPLDGKAHDIRLRQTILRKVEDRWLISFLTLFGEAPFRPDKAGNVFFGSRGGEYYSLFSGGDTKGTNLLSDVKGQPVGCASSGFFDLLQAECLWRGADIIKADGLDWEKLHAAEDSVRKTATPGIYKVVLRFRKGGNDSESFHRSSEASGTEVEKFGFAISDTDVFVPIKLGRKMASRIMEIFVEFSPEKRTPAKFVGAFKGFGAFVVRLEKGKLPAKITPAAKPLPRMMPFLTAHAIEKFSQKHLILRTNRLVGKSRGYRGIYRWQAIRPMSCGTMLLNFQGQLCGVYLRQQREYAEDELAGNKFGFSFDDGMARVVTIAELRKMFIDPDKFMDPNIRMHPRRTRAERHAWLGVEFMPISCELARFWKVEKPTKDGQIGLIITAVYPDSPAGKLGLRPGDILLKIKAQGRDYPTELGKAQDSQGIGLAEFSWAFRHNPGNGNLWKSRRNALSELLNSIGIGKTIKLTYCRRAGLEDAERDSRYKLLTLDYKIELARADLASARKWQNRKIGLTVKDVTYEVRYALGLKKTDPGVVVVKIESGSAGQIARISPMEIITRVDGQPLTSAKQMRDMIAKAKNAGKEKVRLTIQRLGKTRFADLNISAYHPKDDEGIENEKK